MATHQVGTVSELWRFPVKSMLGERLDALEITRAGVVGDRAYALREVVSHHVASAKKFASLFTFRSRYTTLPAPGRPGAVEITLPDGRKIAAEDPNISEILSAALGRKMQLERPDKSEAAHAGIDPKTVFGDVGVEKVFPGLSAETMPDHFGLAKGSFFDTATMHLIATSTLDHLRALRNGEGNHDPRRFRANIYVRTEPGSAAFVEDQWVGGVLQVGANVRIASIKPALRCVMTTHPQEDLPRDLGILRTIAMNHQANLGVFADIEAGGTVRVGDRVLLEK
jgi:uncharacterized protein YcbX